MNDQFERTPLILFLGFLAAETRKRLNVWQQDWVPGGKLCGSNHANCGSATMDEKSVTRMSKKAVRVYI